MILPEPQKFDRKRVTGSITDRIDVGSMDGSIAVVLTNPDDDMSLIFNTTPAGARQLAAILLNQADSFDELLAGEEAVREAMALFDLADNGIDMGDAADLFDQDEDI